MACVHDAGADRHDMVCMLPLACRLFVGSQVWLKEQKEELLSEDDKKRVAERNKRNAEIFGHETMEEDIKRLRVDLARFIESVCLPLIATQSRSLAVPQGDPRGCPSTSTVTCALPGNPGHSSPVRTDTT